MTYLSYERLTENILAGFAVFFVVRLQFPLSVNYDRNWSFRKTERLVFRTGTQGFPGRAERLEIPERKAYLNDTSA